MQSATNIEVSTKQHCHCHARKFWSKPDRTEQNYWSDIWRYRELFYILAWRDISVRYKQTTIGIIWAILRPFLAMVIFTVVFGRIAKMPSHGIPYPILVFAAMLPWQFFSNSLAEASQSLFAPGERPSAQIYLHGPPP
jgi:lipopolysaccharide transport system permease protein